MYLVVMHIFATGKDIPCIVAETEEKAIEWIEKEMDGKIYQGGVHQIKHVELYE